MPFTCLSVRLTRRIRRGGQDRRTRRRRSTRRRLHPEVRRGAAVPGTRPLQSSHKPCHEAHTRRHQSRCATSALRYRGAPRGASSRRGSNFRTWRFRSPRRPVRRRPPRSRLYTRTPVSPPRGERGAQRCSQSCGAAVHLSLQASAVEPPCRLLESTPPLDAQRLVVSEGGECFAR
jgi:hypothetical protein